jgi:V/A-type H+-transporting ATPase subunit C
MFGRKKKGNYAYTVARVKAKKSQLLNVDAYNKMLLMSLPEISRFMSETGYQTEITELTGKFNGIDLIEHATYKNMARLFSGILASTTGELNEMLAADLERWDIWNLKVILRGKSFGIDADSIREDLVPAGSLDSTMLDKLIVQEKQEDVIAAYEKMTDVVIPDDVLGEAAKAGNLTAIEDFLDKHHYERLLASIDPSSRAKRLYQDFIRKEIDIINTETILKLKMEGIHGEPVMKYIIAGGMDIDKKLATQLANAEDLKAAANDLAQLDFYNDIKEALDAQTNSLRGIVAGLEKYKMEQARTFSHLYPLSIIPVIDFMIHKENEVNNIRIIARGLESGLDKQTIEGLLVI